MAEDPPPQTSTPAPSALRRARRRDRRVYLAAHPILFCALSLTRFRPALRVGRRVVVNDLDQVRTVLTEVPLDRTSERTTGGAMRSHDVAGTVFDESGPTHRASRRALARRLDSAGVAALRPNWAPPIREAVERLATRDEVDVCALADLVAGRTTAALLGLELPDARCAELAAAARATAASAAAAELPSMRRVRYHDHIADVLGRRLEPLSVMLALATVTTTCATLPRAVAWTADAQMWCDAVDPVRRRTLTTELLRVLSPTPMLPRVPAADAVVGGRTLRPNDQLLLVVRHAVEAHRRDPSVRTPAPAATSRLVFGAGRHGCPGAGVAQAQVDDLLAALAPHRPRVVRARADRRAALPAWRELVVTT